MTNSKDTLCMLVNIFFFYSSELKKLIRYVLLQNASDNGRTVDGEEEDETIAEVSEGCWEQL